MPTDEISTAMQAAVRRLLQVSCTLAHGPAMCQAAVHHVQEQLDLDSDEAEEMHGVLLEEAQRLCDEHMPDFAEALVPIYARAFTHDEIDALIRFYEGPLGQKLIDAMPRVLAQTTALAEQWSGRLVPMLYRHALKRLR